MSRFRFRLATLVKLREGLRDERRAELAQALEAREVLNQRIAEVESELTALKEDCRAVVSVGAVQVDHLLDASRYELVLRSQQATYAQYGTTLDEEIARRRAALVAADRDVRVLEKLRETQLQRHRSEEARAEAKLLDEIGLVRREEERS